MIIFQDYQDSFFVADVDRLMDLYDVWKAMLPKIHPFYAVKCNPEPVLLKLLASLGTGFDCASKVCIIMCMVPTGLMSASLHESFGSCMCIYVAKIKQIVEIIRPARISNSSSIYD